MITPTRDQIIPWANLIFRSFLTHFAINWIFYQKKGCRFSSPTILWLLVKSLETLIWVNMCYFGVFLTNFSSFFSKRNCKFSSPTLCKFYEQKEIIRSSCHNSKCLLEFKSECTILFSFKKSVYFDDVIRHGGGWVKKSPTKREIQTEFY